MFSKNTLYTKLQGRLEGIWEKREHRREPTISTQQKKALMQ
jgi:hypothetical protein